MREHITICHCDVCGEKVDDLDTFWWGLIENSPRSHPYSEPDRNKEVCGGCRARLYAAMEAKITNIKGE